MTANHNSNDTIVALSTPRGTGALALMRLSGPSVVSVVSSFVQLKNAVTLSTAESHTIHYAMIKDGEEIVDYVMVSVMHAPKTFTGEHTVEITCHNNPLIIDSIINLSLRAGTRIAKPGEFTERAYQHGKLDLLQAEAINELIHAQNQLSLKKSLAQLDGSLSAWIMHLEKRLIHALAWSEASFEFLDDETHFAARINQELSQILATITNLSATFNSQKQVREGLRIALIGSVNAGKSSLFNQLLGKNRAIISPVKGTTRDTIEAAIILKNTMATLIDTAGIRTVNEAIESEGIRRSYDEAALADIILLVIDQSAAQTPEEVQLYTDIYEKFHHKIIVITNKCDLPAISTLVHSLTRATHKIPNSHHNADTTAQILQALVSKADELLARIDTPFLLNERHIHLLASLEDKLTSLLPKLSGPIVHYELVSHELNAALTLIGDVTGKTYNEAAVDHVFKEFCIGK